MTELPVAPRTSPGWRAVLASLERLPQGVMSRAFGRLADLRIPRGLRPLVLGAFARLTGMDLSEAEHDLTAYASMNDLFVRRLKPGSRSWPESPRILGSPVDGVVGESGQVTRGRLLQAKGRSYRAGDLLGDEAAARRCEGGVFLTVYLSPRHYHRIHTPLPGRILRARHVPGSLLPVNDPAVRSVDRLFARNERLAVELQTAVGRIWIVAVGAYNVGRISAAFDPEWAGGAGRSVTNRAAPLPPERNYEPGVTLAAGEEVMAFHLGSTVILLTEPGLRLETGVGPGLEVHAGTVLARPST